MSPHTIQMACIHSSARANSTGIGPKTCESVSSRQQSPVDPVSQLLDMGPAGIENLVINGDDCRRHPPGKISADCWMDGK
jgi:hypothetical protein